MLEGYRRGARGVLDGTRWYSMVLEGQSRGNWTPLISQLIDKLKVAEASLEDLQRNGTVRRFRCMVCNALGAGRSNACRVLRAFRLYVAARRVHGLQRVVCR